MGLVFMVANWLAYYREYLTFAEVGFIVALGYAVSLVFELPTGALADLIGRKNSLSVGFFIAAVGYLIFSFATSFAGFTTATVVFGIGMSLISGADTAFLYDTLKELNREKEFSTLFAKIGFVHRIGLAAATFAGGYLFTLGSNVPYLAMVVTHCIIFLLTFFLTEPKIDSEKFTLHNYLQQTKLGFAQLLKNGYVKRLSLYYLFIGAVTWSLLTYFRLPLSFEFGYNQLQMSWILGVSFLLSSVLLIWLPKYPRIINPATVFYGYPILIAFTIGPAVIMPALAVPLAMVVIQFIGSARFAILDAYTNHEFESKYRATALSSLNMLVSFAYMILVGGSGFLQDQVSTKMLMTGLGIATFVVVMPLAVTLVKEYDRHTTL